MSVIQEMSKTELAATVTITGLAIVFSVLLLLILIFTVFGKTMDAGKKKKSSAKKKSESVQQPSKPAASPVVVQPAVQDGLSGEVVAAITAAITAYEGGNGFTIRSIQKRKASNAGGRPSWAMAGIMDNTRPF